MDKRRPYSAQTKARVLATAERNGGNHYQTAKETGLPRSTVSRWIQEAQQRGELPPTTGKLVAPEDEKLSLADRLEKVVSQMVAVMPQKVEEASLQELTRSLTAILATMNQARAQAGDSQEDIELYERLVRHMAQFSDDGAEDRNVPPDASAQAD